MSDAIENVIEMIEDEFTYTQTTEARYKNIANIQGIKNIDEGPPDVCYLIKEEKGGIISHSKRSGYSHFIYGIDSSSSSAVAAYIYSLISKSESDLYF